LSATVNFLSLVEEDIHAVENLMQQQADGYNPDVGAALSHLLSSGGKRMRPSVTLLVGKMLGSDRQRLVTLSAAIELLHTATLVHDDLIDGALLRRGITTLNAKWSPGATVLTGDFLFACAAKLAADTESVAVMKIFANTLKVIVDGEVAQMFASRCQVNRAAYDQRIYAKTASLFETSARSAAIISPIGENYSEDIARYGYNIGMAFQIVDDILDFTGEQATMGKPVGSDLRQGLVTLPVIFYASEYPEDPAAQMLLDGRCIPEEREINRLVNEVRTGKGIESAMNEAKVYVDKAIAILQRMPASPERQALEEIARYIVARNN